MLEQRIQQQIFESADLLYQAADALARPVAEAVQALVGSLTGGGKLLVSGEPLASHFASLCVNGFERDRPPLAAMALPAGESMAAVRALGQPGDVLLLLVASDDAEPACRAVIEAAHEKEMLVVAIAGPRPAWQDALSETDVCILAPFERVPRRTELQLLMLHMLADAVDLQLMGELDPI